MNIKLHELKGRLKASILPIYIVSGDEPLQLGEACDLIRERLRAEDYSEREVMYVDKGFDWNQLSVASNELSLFATRRIIELRMPTGKPGDKGAKALIEYSQRPAEDTVLLIVSGKLDKASQNTKWFKALNKEGGSVSIWPVDLHQFPGWLKQRLQSRGLRVSNEAVDLLAERAEGNLLAAAQEVEKIALLHQEGVVDAETVAHCVTDSARYDIYSLVDAALDGQSKRVARMVGGLRTEGTEPVLLLWAVSRELRAMVGLAQAMASGQNRDAVFAQARVWPKRKAIVSKALSRHNGQSWAAMLQQASCLDRMIKGMETGNIWDELLQLCLQMAGLRLWLKP